MAMAFLEGSDAIVKGALDAGCNFFAGYPITPATPILIKMLRELPRMGEVGIQGEDEIASAGFCIGAAMAGKKVMTATSGPGISLYSENIGLGIMAEVPMVIVNAQRMGPATGGATTGAHGDILFTRWGTSGGYPVIALCPTDIPTSYCLTVKAFNLAERFRCPVFLLTCKDLILMRESVDLDELKPEPLYQRRMAPEQENFIPYDFADLADVPLFSPVGGPNIIRFTTSIHDRKGVITKDIAEIDRKLWHLSLKIEKHVDEISCVRQDCQEGAKSLILSFGITARSAMEALDAARKDGKKVSSLVIYSLWPVPEKEILMAAKGVERVIVPELNLGQYILEVRKLLKDVEIIGINEVSGLLIHPSAILEKVI